MIKGCKRWIREMDKNNKEKFGRASSCFKKQNDGKELGNGLSPAGR